MPNLYAVIIGINAYPSNPLSGCVNDAMSVSDYFQSLCAAQGTALQWKPKYLFAPNSEDARQIEAIRTGAIEFSKPTRNNIIAAFDHFRQAKDGDYCLLCYTGHGSTAPAPDVFKGFTPGDVLQTIVCQDSRIKGNPDILDKELGYLIASVLEGKEPSNDKKGVHFLAILDCCHSGTITRSGGDDLAPKARMAVQGFAPDEIVGFEARGNCFYTPFKPGQKTVDPNGGLRHARHINLSGARNSESAYEIFFMDKNGNRQKRGVFTWSLIETLQQSGVNISYGELMHRAEIAVRSRVDNQIPILGKTDIEDNNLYFLRSEFKTPALSFEVQCDKNGVWKLNGGTINGISGIDSGKKASVKLNDGRIVAVLSAQASEAVLSGNAFTEADKQDMTLRASVHEMPLPEIKIGLSKALSAAMRQDIQAAFAKNKPLYAALTKDNEVPQYLIMPLPDAQGTPCYALTRPGSSTPVFMRTANSNTFVSDIGKVARYEHVLQLSNPQSKLPPDAVQIDIKTLEGVSFSAATLNSVPETSFKTVKPAGLQIPYPELVRVSGRAIEGGKTQQPAIKVRITPKAGSSYFVGVLYCDAKCAINYNYLPIQKIGGAGEKPFVDLTFNHKGVDYQSIPLTIDEEWKKIGVSEVQDYLIFFVSTTSFDLSKYKQDGIKLDITRSAGFDDEEEIPQNDWMTIKIPIQIVIPKEKQAISGDSGKSFGAFTVVAPAGFSAQAAAISKSSLIQGRGDASEAAKYLPPAHIWDGVEGAQEVFARGVSAAPDSHLSMLELTQVTGQLSTTHPLIIQPSDALGEEEAIIPFAYDAEHDIYYPIGYTDAQGNVRIEQMPTETPGQIGQVAEGQRSVGSSIKLFFQKLVWSKITGRPTYNRLSLVTLDAQQNLQRLNYNGGKSTEQLAALAQIKAAVLGGNVLLVIHGIIGDSDGSAPFVLQRGSVTEQFKTILTFDYENLDTDIGATAKVLKQFLMDCAMPEQELTIVAHSMGGLVSRVLIEQLDGAKWVKQLIQMGTPNGGSEVGDFRKKLFGWISLGINGIAALKPYLPFCSLLWKGLDQRIFRTLDQMQPGSDFIKALNSTDGSSRKVPYSLVAGNTSIIESSAGENESVYKQVLTGLKERGKYILLDYAVFGNEPNDMAVRVESMKSVPGGFVSVTEVPTDHISYFNSSSFPL